jgi:transposase InsO family protein
LGEVLLRGNNTGGGAICLTTYPGVATGKQYKKLATTIGDPQAPYAENLLRKHETELAGVNRAWVGDVVMVVTKKERGCLASLLDRYSRRCVGWAVSAINDTALTLKGLNRAIAERQPEVGLIHHTDHGLCLYQW